ncbi:MAG: PilZ domain-containing protein [Novosphingobium sp.]
MAAKMVHSVASTTWPSATTVTLWQGLPPYRPAMPAPHDCPIPASVSESGRRHGRAALILRCEVRQGTRSWQMTELQDLSPSGFRLVGLSHPDPSKSVSIRIPGMQLLSARIRWQAGPMVGCEFSTPLHIAVFDFLTKTTI